jgi:hypothetical protein
LARKVLLALVLALALVLVVAEASRRCSRAREGSAAGKEAQLENIMLMQDG